MQKKLKTLEERLAGYEGESVEIKIKENATIKEEIENMLETKNRSYLLYTLSTLY